MHQLRKFLFASEGESACLLWLNAEQLNCAREKSSSKKLMSRIQQLHLVDGAPFSLGRGRGTRASSLQSKTTRMSTVARLQREALRALTSYWCPRYAQHLKEGTTLCQSAPHPKTQSHDSACSHSNLSGQERNEKEVTLPRIIVDVGEGGRGPPARPPRVILAGAELRLPSIGRASAEVACEGKGQAEGVACDLISQSTQQLFKLSNSTLHAPHPQSALQCHAFLSASLRADCLAGRPLLRFLSAQSSHTCHEALNCLLFWESVEGIFTQDELRRWYHRQFGHVDAPVCPHLVFFGELDLPVVSCVEDLVEMFVADGAPHCLELPKQVRKKLKVLLSKGLGQSLLILAQEESLKVSLSCQ